MEKQRSFGSDAQKVSELSLIVGQNLQDQGVYGCYKHFPGHGAAAGDTHKGFSYTDKTLDELKQGVLEAVRNGSISEERIDASVVRIVEKKLEMEQTGEER